MIDNLQFITESGRNRIQRINEQATDLVFKLKGFRPEANGSTSTGGIDYTYDANGNSAGVLFKTGANNWKATRGWMGRKGLARPGQEVHHVVIQRNGPIGKHVPDKIKNQPWNLKPMPSDPRIHDAIHGKGVWKNRQLPYMYWYSPDWVKGVIGYPGRFLEPNQKK